MACRQLGFAATGIFFLDLQLGIAIYLFLIFPGAVALFTGFTNGVGQIWLDNVQCHGTETRLVDCPAPPLGTHNCGHVEDAGVRCLGKPDQIIDITLFAQGHFSE